MTPPPSDTPSDGGSIRDRLRSPAPNDEANSGGDSRGSDVTDASFQQTDSRAALAARGGDEGQRTTTAPQAHAISQHDAQELTEREARAAERKVAALFLLSIVGVVGFVITYFAAPFRFTAANNIYFTPLLAIFMALALAGIGAGAVLWAKTLMVDEEAVQERHGFASDPDEKRATAEALQAGFVETGLPRRKLLRNTLLLDLGPYAHKERALRTTAWKKGVRLVRRNGTPIRLGDLSLGALETVYPDVPGGVHMADSPAMLIRMRPEEFVPRAGREDWAVNGHVVYSVICTHLGCPVKLYEQQTHHLFCPCHQSTFDASHGAKVVFGPAARPLPQLAISVDDEGYFVADGDFSGPVGPSFWERKP